MTREQLVEMHPNQRDQVIDLLFAQYKAKDRIDSVWAKYEDARDRYMTGHEDDGIDKLFEVVRDLIAIVSTTVDTSLIP